MKKLHAIVLGLAAVVTLVVVGLSSHRNAFAGDEKTSRDGPAKAAVQRTRKTIQMLDNIYKQTVVLITDKYVHDEDDFAAGSAAVLLFKNISKSGSHQVRLIDATGQPYKDTNVAKDQFERDGIKRLKKGAASYEEVVQIKGKHHLRVVTAVPVVMKKCIMCHEHYADVKKGEPIGAISYTMLIE